MSQLSEALEAREKATKEETETLELKPCPFCGGKAERYDVDTIDDTPDAGGSFVHCTKCEASTSIVFGEKIDLEERWNERKLEDLALAWIAEAMEDMASYKSLLEQFKRCNKSPFYSGEYWGDEGGDDELLTRLESLLARVGR